MSPWDGTVRVAVEARLGGAARFLVRVLDCAVDELHRARTPLGLDPPAITGETAREVGLGVLILGRHRGRIGLVSHAAPFSEAGKRFG